MVRRLGRTAPALAVLIAGLLFTGRAGAVGLGTGSLSLLEPGSRGAAGIGGDPFLEPVADESGWWAWPGSPAGVDYRFEFRGGEPLTPRSTGGQGDLHHLDLSGTVTVPARVAGRRWILAGGFASPNWKASWESRSGGFALSGSGLREKLAIRVPDLVPGLTLQATLPLCVGLRYQAGSRLIVQGDWGQETVSDRLHSNIHEEPISASLNLNSDRHRVDSRLKLLMGSSLEVSHTGASYRRIEGRLGGPHYQLFPHGTSGMEQATIRWGPGGRDRLLVRWTAQRLDVEADATWDAERFGILNYGRANVYSWLFAAQGSIPGSGRWIADFESARAFCRARAEVESWPFTDAVIDLLGARRIYRTSLDADWTRWHGGLEKSLGAGCHVRGGLGWYDVHLKGREESWIPLIIVLPGEAERREIPLRRLRLAALAFGFSWWVEQTELTLAAEQVIYARSEYLERAGGGADQPDVVRGRPGGSHAVVKLVRHFSGGSKAPRR